MAILKDDYILQHLITLAGCGEITEEEDFAQHLIPFGNIGFIKERFWKTSHNYRDTKNPRPSHPGLSVSSKRALVVFGSSKVDNYDPNDKNYFFVNPDECAISKRRMRFDLSTSIEATYEMLDRTRGDYEPISEKKMQELRDAGYE